MLRVQDSTRKQDSNNSRLNSTELQRKRNSFVTLVLFQFFFSSPVKMSSHPGTAQLRPFLEPRTQSNRYLFWSNFFLRKSYNLITLSCTEYWAVSYISCPLGCWLEFMIAEKLKRKKNKTKNFKHRSLVMSIFPYCWVINDSLKRQIILRYQ